MRYEKEAMTRRMFCAASATLGVASVGALAGCSAPSKSASFSEASDELSLANEKDEQKPVQSEGSTGVEDKLYIVDTIKPKPGDGKSFLDDYMSTYAPLAEAAGMTLVACVVAPPIWIDTDSNIVQVTWTVDDIAEAAWAMNSATRYNPAYVEWWGSVRNRVVLRDRSYYASESYMEVLNNV